MNGSLTFNTPATSSSPAGSYSVVPGGLSAGNYAITYVDGTLTVTPPARPVTVTGVGWETVKSSHKKSIKVLDVYFSGQLSSARG